LDEGGSLIHLRRRFYKYASPTDFEKSVSIRVHPWLKIQTPIIIMASLCDGERDRPGCRFRRRAENPSTN
jgi:hypothetical protein